MNKEKEYCEVLENANSIALATTANNIPNVRIVNFVFRADSPKTLYFTSDRTNQKVAEFNQNTNVALTTIPTEGIAHVRSKQATVKKSESSMEDIKELFIARIPGYDQTIEAIGHMLDVFEIHIQEATVISGFEESFVF